MDKKDNAGFLGLAYYLGSQPDASQDPDNKEYIKFAKQIDREAKKKKLGPYEYLDYIIEKKTFPKFAKIYEHADMEKVKKELLGPAKLKKTGKAFLNEKFVMGEVEVWEGNGIEYIVKTEDIIKFQSPKVSVSQLKNLSLLMGMIQEQQFNEPVKRASCKFTISQYAERRGYSKKEVHSHGKFLDELRRDIYSGAYTTYRINKIMDGKKYIVHNTFYALYEPFEPKDEWIIEFNAPYSDQVIEVLNGEARQFFVRNPKAIEDRHTTQRPYLYYFYQQIVTRKQESLASTPVKIKNLLAGMQVRQKILDRPKECFKLLHECIIYFSENYPPHPEIESFNIYNDYSVKGAETSKITLKATEAFKNMDYEGFKNLLSTVNVNDLRDAYISFKRPPKTAKKKKLGAEEEELLKRTLRWFDGKVTKIPVDIQESMIKMYIGKLGASGYKSFFEAEGNKYNPSAVEFLTKALPKHLKETRQPKQANKDHHKDCWGKTIETVI